MKYMLAVGHSDCVRKRSPVKLILCLLQRPPLQCPICFRREKKLNISALSCQPKFRGVAAPWEGGGRPGDCDTNRHGAADHCYINIAR